MFQLSFDMGTSSSVVPDKASDKKNKEIEEYLQKSKIEEAQIVKLLLLGRLSVVLIL